MITEFHEDGTAKERKKIKDACCYRITLAPGSKGRPVHAGDADRGAITARGVARDDWRRRIAFETARLAEEDRIRVGTAWLADGLLEHASIAEFSRFALSLMRLGAPAHLLEAAHRAALDEIGHAEMAFGIASVLLGREVGPGPLSLDHAEPLPTTRLELVTSTVIDGCIGETIAGVEASIAAQSTTMPAIAGALQRIAYEERDHASLAFTVVKWAIETASTDERSRIDRELARSIAEAEAECTGATDAAHDDADDSDYGRLPRKVSDAVRRACLADVIVPGLVALRAHGVQRQHLTTASLSTDGVHTAS